MISKGSTTPVCHADAGELLTLPWGHLAVTASAKVGNSASLTFGRATILAGHNNPRHRHPNCDEILHVLSGCIEHSLGDARYIMEPGDTISIPQGVWHQAVALGKQDAEVIICFNSPDRITEIDDRLP